MAGATDGWNRIKGGNQKADNHTFKVTKQVILQESIKQVCHLNSTAIAPNISNNHPTAPVEKERNGSCVQH